MSSPRFFVASVTPRTWIPWVLVIKQGDQIAGLVYLKERKIAGIPSGILYGDSTLGAMTISEPDRHRSVLEASLRFLLSSARIRGVRLAVRPDAAELEDIGQISRSLGTDYYSQHAVNHLVLDLPPSYEQFLESLGSRTRRNFRYYRRRFEGRGGEYVNQMTWSEFRHASFELLNKSVVGADAEGLHRAHRILCSVDRPILSGLRDKSGEWLAILGGWRDPDPVLFVQMNDDRDCGSESLSAVLRSYWIENLILHGERTLLFWAGVGLPLSRSCRPLPTIRVYVDSSSQGWRAVRSLLKSAVPILPRRLLPIADWIVPLSTTAS